MKKLLALGLALSLTFALAGCGNNTPADPSAAPSESPAVSLTPEERAGAYADAVTAARDEEMNTYYPVETTVTEDLTNMILPMLGLTAEDMESFAIAVSAMNVKAYGIALIMPAEGKEDTVKQGLETFVENQKASFEHYLEDQFEIAQNAKVEVLSDGTVALVMCENQDSVLDSLKTALEG